MSNMDRKRDKNRFAREREIEAVPGINPNVDMKLFREWQEIIKIIENIPTAPQQKESIKEQPLQPIPLRLFSR